MGNLVFAFPVMCVDVLDKSPKVLEVSELTHVADLIFDLVRETSIEFVAVGGFPVTAKLRAEIVELDEVADNVMISFIQRLSSWCSALPTGSWGLNCPESSARNSRQLSIHRGHWSGAMLPSRLGSNHSRAIPFR